jgi:hypothetical protein
VVVLLPTILVTNNASEPTLSTAFWLFMVAMRGLESVCTTPWVSRNVSRAAKLAPWNAMPNIDPLAIEAAVSSAPAPLAAPKGTSGWPAASGVDLPLGVRPPTSG